MPLHFIKEADVMKVLKCEICGNMIELINDNGMVPVCCGQDMTELIPCSTDGVKEKHVPVVDVCGRKVNVMVGEAAHPMTKTHFIEWIAIETSTGVHRTHLKPESKPMANFTLEKGEELVAAYAYCNLHGLWKSI